MVCDAEQVLDNDWDHSKFALLQLKWEDSSRGTVDTKQDEPRVSTMSIVGLVSPHPHPLALLATPTLPNPALFPKLTCLILHCLHHASSARWYCTHTAHAHHPAPIPSSPRRWWARPWWCCGWRSGARRCCDALRTVAVSFLGDAETSLGDVQIPLRDIKRLPGDVYRRRVRR